MPVYFAKHARLDLIKIGMSEWPCYRVRHLRLASGDPPEFQMLGFVGGGREMERVYHDLYSAHVVPINGMRENFRYSSVKDDIAAVCSNAAAVAFMRPWTLRDWHALFLSMRVFGGLHPLAAALQLEPAALARRADMARCHAVRLRGRVPPDWRKVAQLRNEAA